MKFDLTRFYLVAQTRHERLGILYLPGEVLRTPAGRPRSFATVNRAMGYRGLHLGAHFPVDARLGADLTFAPVATTVPEIAPLPALPRQRDIWARVAVNLWADEPVDTEGEWDEAKAEVLRAAFDRLALARVVETAVQDAIAAHPDVGGTVARLGVRARRPACHVDGHSPGGTAIQEFAYSALAEPPPRASDGSGGGPYSGNGADRGEGPDPGGTTLAAGPSEGAIRGR